MTPTTATVISVDETGYRVYVLVDGPAGGSSPTIPCEVLTAGPRDALRIEHPPLPTPGTRGVVAFLRNDHRNGVWLGAINGPLNAAHTTRPGFGQVAYSARWSGYWHLQDNKGQEITTWPDGSSLTIGAPAAASRYIVNGAQQQVRASFTQAERVASVPAAFPMRLAHISGTAVTIDAAGNVSVASVGTVIVTAGSTVTVSASGAMTLNAPSGLTVNGNVTVNGSIGATGDVTAEGTSLHTHVHSGVTAGVSDTGPPV